MRTSPPPGSRHARLRFPAWLSSLQLLLAGVASGALAVVGWRAMRHDVALLAQEGAAMTAGHLDDVAAAGALAALTLCLGWTSVVLTLAGLGHLPGASGVLLRRCAAALTPAAARAALAVACGVGPVALAVGPAHAAAPALTTAGSSGGTTERGSSMAGPAALPALDRPSSPPRSESQAAAESGTHDHGSTGEQAVTRPHTGDGVCVVRPGDSLWSLTRAWLQSHQSDASDAAIAREWPRWYQANRHEIGPDPDEIHPGERLLPPTGS